MSVADPNGEWELEIHMPEDRIGHVALAQKDYQPQLPVQFILATNPGVQHTGVVEEVHAHAEVRPEEETRCWCEWRFPSRNFARPICVRAPR